MRRARGDQPVDRRSSPRMDAKVPININPHNVSARTQDMSLGGMKVRVEITPLPCQKNDEITVLVNQPYFKFQGQAEILWASPKDGTVGIKFTQLDKEAKKSLNEFLSLFGHVPNSNR